jgi:general secretion pathway protein M
MSAAETRDGDAAGSGWAGARGALQQTWKGLAARERLLVGVAAALVFVLLLWLVALRPALGTLRSVPAQLEGLDGQWQAMQQLANEARELRALPKVAPEQGRAALQAATARLGDKGRLTVQGDRITLTVTGVDAPALQDWLEEARAAARARPVEATLTRAGSGFNGNIVLSLGGGS